MKFEYPEIEVVRINVQDVITTSGDEGVDTGEGGLPPVNPF